MQRRRGQTHRRAPASKVAWLLVLALSIGCAATPSPRGSGTDEHSGQGLVTLGERVAVLPFRDGSPLPIYGNHVMCHLTGEHLDAGDVPKGTGEKLGEILAAQLVALGVDVVPYEEVVRLLSGFDPETVSRYEPSLGAEVARRTGAEKAILGVVSRFEERSGSRFASGSPARVSFSLALVDARSGAVTHKLAVNREQAPLTSNLLSVAMWWRRGFRWWSRDEVAEDALAAAARALTGAPSQEGVWASMQSPPVVEGPPSPQSYPPPRY